MWTTSPSARERLPAYLNAVGAHTADLGEATEQAAKLLGNAIRRRYFPSSIASSPSRLAQSSACFWSPSSRDLSHCVALSNGMKSPPRLR